jgi:superfamily II DNA or RNA helicase
VVVVAHRRELIEQISKTLTEFGIEHGVIVSGKETDETKRVQVASVQTLARRGVGMSEGAHRGQSPCASEAPWAPTLVIVDEAHHALAKTYRMMWEWWPKAKFLGLTATPCRLNNAPFTDLFQTLLQSWSIQEFIDKGWLSDF